jgi:integrase
MTKRRGNKEGTIYQRLNGKWRAQMTLNGSRLSYTGDSRSEAQAWLRDMSNRIENGLTIRGARATFSQLLVDWLETSKPRLSGHSWRTYHQLVRDYIGPKLGDVRLQELSPSLIQRFYNQLVADGIGLRTAQKTHTLIHASLNTALKLGVIGRNPDDSTQPPKPIHKEMRFLNEDQVKHLLSFAKANRDRNFALYFLAIATGMRQGELLALKWSEVDLRNGVLNVKFNLQRMPGGGLQLQGPKTKTSIRTIKLGKDSVRVLNQQKDLLLKERERIGNIWQETDFVFPSTVGSPMDATNLWKCFRQIVKKAKLPAIRFHDLRHTAASLMLNNGVDVLVASNRLGHAKPSITLDVYGHLISSTQSKAADIIDSLITE